MTKEIMIVCIGVIIGMVLMFQMVKGRIGDEYEINKPKVRGKGNALDVSQVNKKKRILGIFNRKNKKT